MPSLHKLSLISCPHSLVTVCFDSSSFLTIINTLDMIRLNSFSSIYIVTFQDEVEKNLSYKDEMKVRK